LERKKACSTELFEQAKSKIFTPNSNDLDQSVANKSGRSILY